LGGFVFLQSQSFRNGADEITVAGINKNTGKVKMEMRDSKTKAILQTVVF
jgi:hypothetical protein